MVRGRVSRPQHRRPTRRFRVASAVIAVSAFAVSAGVLGLTSLNSRAQPGTPPGLSLAESWAAATPSEPPPDASPPPGPADPEPVPGTFTVATGTSPVAGTSGDIVEYRVEVEDVVDIPAAEFATAVDAIAADPRGWTKDGTRRFQRSTDGTLRIVLASPATADQLCAPLQTEGQYSCRNGNDVVINAERWTTGVPHFQPLDQYRIYVINHEVGHALGRQHERCGGPGQAAPVMVQQTISLQGCQANPWP